MDKPCGEEREVNEQTSCVREEVEESKILEVSSEQDELSLLLSNGAAAAAEAEQLHQQSLASAAENMQREEMEALKAQVISEASELSAKICELESEVNQSWALRADVEAQLNNSNQRCAEHENRANALHERNLELEELIRSSLSRIEEMESIQKSQITHQLEQERAVQAAAESESSLETQNQQMSCRVKELESAMEQLEKEFFQEETRARYIFERNQELEDLLMSFRFKDEDSERRVGELEFLLDSQRSRIEDFEKRCGLAEEKSAQYADMLSSLTTQLEAAVQKNREIEDKLNFVKSNYDDAERKLKEQSLEVESIKEDKVCQVEHLHATISELESALSQSLLLRSQLEAKMETVSERCGQRILELEDSVRFWKSRVEDESLEADNEKRLAESLEAIGADKRDLEEAVHDAMAKLEDENLVQYQELMEKGCQVEQLQTTISELESALSQSLLLRSQLEAEMETVSERCGQRILELEDSVRFWKSRVEDEYLEADNEKRLAESLEAIAADKKDLEEAVHDAMAKLEVENLVQYQELMEKGCQVEQLQTTISELESALSQSLLLRSQLEAEMETVSERCGQRILELEDSVRFWKSRVEDESLEADNEKRLAESLEASAADKKDLEEAVHDAMAKLEVENLVQYQELMEKGCQVEQLQTTIFELESALSQSLLLRSQLEAEMETVSERCGERILELEDSIRFWESRVEESERRESRIKDVNADTEAESLEAIAADKRNLEAAVHDTIAKLEVENLVQNEELMAILKYKDSELDSLLDYERQEVEAQKVHVDETMQELSLKELQVKELSEYLEEQVKSHEIKLLETGESTRAELEQYATKVQDQKHVIQELEAKLGLVESRLNDLQQELCAAVADKEAAVANLEASMKMTQELKQELYSEKQSFQTMVATTMEEKQLLHEANRDAEIELQRVKNELERELKEYEESNEGLRGELENLKLQAASQNEVEHLVLAAGVMFEKQEEEKMLESVEKVQKGLEEEPVLVSPPPPSANAELDKSSPEGPIKNIRVAVGVGLVSIAAAILAGKK